MNNFNHLTVTTSKTHSIIEVESNLESFKNADLKFIVPQLLQGSVPVIIDLGELEILDILTLNKLEGFKRLSKNLGCGFYINVKPETPAMRQIEHAGIELSAILQRLRKLKRA